MQQPKHLPKQHAEANSAPRQTCQCKRVPVEQGLGSHLLLQVLVVHTVSLGCVRIPSSLLRLIHCTQLTHPSALTSPPHTITTPQVKEGKAAKYKLGVSDPKLGSAIQDTTGIPCVANESVGEVLRGVRAHFTRYLDGLKDGGEGEGWRGGLASRVRGEARGSEGGSQGKWDVRGSRVREGEREGRGDGRAGARGQWQGHGRWQAHKGGCRSGEGGAGRTVPDAICATHSPTTPSPTLFPPSSRPEARPAGPGPQLQPRQGEV